MVATVIALATTPVKGLRVVAAAEVALGPSGAADDRRFHLVDERGWMVSGKRIGALSTVVADYRHGDRSLTLTFPGGHTVGGAVELGELIDTRFFSRPASARLVLGPWADSLSEHVGQPLRIVEGVGRAGVDRGRSGAVSLISSASLARLAQLAGTERVDARRLRMLVEIDGVVANEEDGWVGDSVRLGGALVRLNGHVGRCVTTTRHPESGLSDLPTLDLLRSYRGGLDTSEPLALGVYGEVLEEGTVALGDAVEIA
ncbi:MAG: MOSC N-terminal beta barrel domain-containing protein [Solirubrobacteraceae bacterium]